MDDAAGALIGLLEIVAALVSLLVEILLVAVELAALAIEFAIWGIAALFGRAKGRPQRRHFTRPAILKSGSKRLIAYLLIFLGVGLFFGGRAIYHHYFTAEIVLRNSLGLRANNIDVMWVSDTGKTRNETIGGTTRYLKNRWDELHIVDEDHLPQTIELTKTRQEIHLKSQSIERLKEEAIGKIGKLITSEEDNPGQGLNVNDAVKLLRDKINESQKSKEGKEPSP